MIIAAVGLRLNVTGRRIAIVEAGPMPGSTPMIWPTVTPTAAANRFSGCSATPKPSISNRTVSTSESPGPARQGDLEPATEEQGEERRQRNRGQYRRSPWPAEDAHESEQQEGERGGHPYAF